jgi:uncharacterized protein (DUF2267 family)
MNYNEIILKVQEQAGLENENHAEQSLRAVLGTLGECIYRKEDRQLAAQLPKELKDVFFEYQGPERNRAATINYPLEEFYNRVKGRAKLTSFQEAQRLSKVVLHVLQEAVGEGEIKHIQHQMPEDFKDLFNFTNVKILQREREEARKSLMSTISPLKMENGTLNERRKCWESSIQKKPRLFMRMALRTPSVGMFW